jgi:hypothetical protein
MSLLSQPDYCVISGVELVSMYLSLPGLVRIKGKSSEESREKGRAPDGRCA